MKTNSFQIDVRIDESRAAEFFGEHRAAVFKRTDRLFGILLPLQWLAGIAAAVYLTPFTWTGAASSIHPHVWAAIFFGGVLISLPLFLIVKQPGATPTRYVIAVSQMLASGLLIHLTGGRIETHFHVFGSLAFLSFYRDWRVLIPATAVTGIDHLVRGWLYPFSVYGIATVDQWRWLEHVAWVVFEDAFLIASCRRSVGEMWEIARRTAALESNEERYRAVVEQTEAGIVLLEPETMRVVECNEAFSRLLGCHSISEAKSLTAFDFNADGSWQIESVQRRIGEHKRAVFSGEKNYRRRDGSLVPVEINVTFINYGGTHLFCVGIRDITERNNMENALRAAHDQLEARVARRTAELVRANESLQIEVNERKRAQTELCEAQEFLRTVVDNVPNMIFVKDEESRYTLANRAKAELYDTTIDDLIGKTDADFCSSAGDVDRMLADDRDVLETLEDKISYEEKFVAPDGAVHWLHIVKRPLVFGGGKARQILGIATDLTEQKALEARLRHAQKMESIGQLAAGIAHEINTPSQYVGDNTRFLRGAFADINHALVKYGELVEAGRENSSVAPEKLAQIEREIENLDIDYLIEEVPRAIGQSLEGISRIGKIVESMRTFAHPGAIEKTAADINRAIESTITVAHSRWKYIAELEIDFDETLPPVPCLLDEFNQVILNMIVNAAHAIADVVGDGSGGKGKITVTTHQVEDDWAEVRITDTGAGIPPEAQSRIFDPFFTTKEVGRGTGQGLAISHTVIVEKHGGQIDFQTAPGIGTTFIIRLPLDNVAADVHAPPTAGALLEQEKVFA